VVSGHDRHPDRAPARRQRRSELAQRAPGGSQRLAHRPLAQLQQITEQDEAVDAGESVDQRGADLGTPRQIALGARAQVQVGYDECAQRGRIPRSGSRERLADRLGQHEADVLGDDLELPYVLGAAATEELDQALDQLLRGARA
jgi:hypothetical protein